MSKAFLFLCFTIIAFINSHAQSLFTEKEMVIANTADTISYLTDEEKKVILYMNLARIDGKRFYKSFIPDYVKKHNKKYGEKIGGKNKYWVSLILDLNKVRNLKMLYPHRNLCDAARFHANDLTKTGVISHDSSDGTDFAIRLKRFYPDVGIAGENC